MNTRADEHRQKDFPIYVGYADCSGRELDIFLYKFTAWRI